MSFFLNKPGSNSGGGGGTPVSVVDNLTSNSKTSALSANQGRVLNEKITEHEKAIASTDKLGHVKVDGSTITIDPVTGVISSTATGGDSVAYAQAMLPTTVINQTKWKIPFSNYKHPDDLLIVTFNSVVVNTDNYSITQNDDGISWDVNIPITSAYTRPIDTTKVFVIMVKGGSSGGSGGDVTQVEMGISQFKLVTGSISQNSWKIPMTTFNPLKDTIIVIRNTTTLSPDMYVIEEKADGLYVTLSIPAIVEISENNLSVIIFKNKAVIPDDTFDGSLLADGTVTLPKLSNEVNDFFSYVEQQVQIANNSWKSSFPTLPELQNAFPSGDDAKYAVVEDGFIYSYVNGFWENTNIIASGISIPNKSITPEKTDFFILSKNLFDKNNVIISYQPNEATGEVVPSASYDTFEFKKAKPLTEYTLSIGYRVVFYDSSDKYISGFNLLGVANAKITTPPNTSIIRFALHKTSANKNTFMFVEGSSLPSVYEPYGLSYIPNDKLQRPSDLSRNDFGNIFLLGPDLPRGKDLNTLNAEGNFTCQANGNYKNLPEGIRTDAAFLVKNIALFKGGNRWFLQSITEFSDVAKQWTRRLDTTGTGTLPWVSIISSLKSTLQGKKLVCFGDSVTEFGNYPKFIGDKTGSISYNCGFGGTRMAYHTDQYYDAFSMSKIADSIVSGDFTLQQKAIDNFSGFSNNFRNNFNTLKSLDFNSIDYVTIFHGTNDYMGTNKGTVDLGFITDQEPTTFYGAINYVLKTILTKYPKLKVTLITPTWRLNHHTLSPGDTDTNPNADGVYLKSYVEAIVKTAALNHVPSVDLYHTSGINKYNYNVYLVDTVHPNTYGFEYLGNKIGSILNSIY